jgi:hypothetical protein
LQKKLLQIKTAITFAYRLEKIYNIYKKLSIQKVTSDFNGRMPFAQIPVSQNSNGKYENRNILDFVKKNEKNDFLRIFSFLLLFFPLFSYFEVFKLFWNFLSFLNFFEFKN